MVLLGQGPTTGLAHKKAALPGPLGYPFAFIVYQGNTNGMSKIAWWIY